MFINNGNSEIEVSFDMDIRKDKKCFEKVLEAFQNKQAKNKNSVMSDDDMEMFLTGCLKPEEVESLIGDGRLSTLMKVFTEFFSQTIQQYNIIVGSLEQSCDVLIEANEQIQDFSERIAIANQTLPKSEED